MSAEGLNVALGEEVLDETRIAGRFSLVLRSFLRKRMAVFGLIGWFLIKAALDFDPDEAVALDGALAKVAHAPYGPLLLGIVAAGLIGFGAFSLVESRYRRV